ncbi:MULTISPECIES: DUF1707 domain-containing protein [unclassified Solwaraspora]|uniref:DUF1707 SHOCT-like domain-containing protein n=1 Tax=unclassified Solwaraspora TaxID=2627926 RepID=UPI00248B39CA|nr:MULTISPECIES: DUF1707 domain-containing protein [unclassified Solwaraspora]WBB98159.1 DUF1707 domain-containing protein [Solwaraspora sp. WMMA2059]WBC23287.1 DUF1707 domain-containing protein [Solwaraspora sp. WMMA2080]WJK34630.1 DUF1707 domain-containing protein [Solwaraspora sp. WMMA2065]
MDPATHSSDDHLRVSDTEREQVVELLGQATAEGRLTLDEYADRATEAHQAKTRGELARLTADLPIEPSGGLPVAAGPGALAARGPAYPAVPGSGATLPAPVERMVAIFGDEVRKGHWLVPDRVEARAVFGDCKIELQDAQIQHQVTTIEATAIFGSVTVYVPEGVDVRMTGTAVFGDKKSKLTAPPRPGAPVIQVVCNVIFGSVVVRPPKRKWW